MANDLPISKSGMVYYLSPDHKPGGLRERGAAAALVNEGYIQHTPVVADRRAGLVDLVTKIKNKIIPAPTINNVRYFEDGDLAVLHHDVKWPNRKAMFEIFRFADGLAVEHWSGIQDHPEETANGNSMTDGPTHIEDRNLTEVNKKIARDFVETVLIGGRFARNLEFNAENLVQHNPFLNNTAQGLLDGIMAFQAKGIIVQFDKVVKVLGEGNFVLVCSLGKFAGKDTAFFDLFRVQGGKIAEHWDVIQEIPEKSVNDNGFFGF